MALVGDRYIDTCHKYTMSEKTAVISVRVPRNVAHWFNEQGGSPIIKSVLYAYVLVQTCGVGNSKKAALIRSIIEETVDNDLESVIEDEFEVQPSMKLD